ncbi:AI-2E family transporter [Bradyrhizobium yuanmingense]|uniref:AI-2E family transporter n=1 Tax=Bradyrhizobium yuanmingense TaxID=108015 RepID=UPI000FE3F16C|nr:AI-2E family transporter [Bradyrhizobium yuanmingense]
MRLGLLGLLIFWTLLIIRPFGPILAWSGVLAVALHPLFASLTGRLGGRPHAASVVLTVITLGVIIGPAAWLGLSAVEGLKDLAGQVGSGDLALQAAPERIRHWPLIGPQLYELWNQAYTNIRAVLRDAMPYIKPIAGFMLSFAGDTSVGMLQFILSVLVAGYLHPHGEQLVAALRAFLTRIVPDQSEHFLELAGATIRAVSQGVIGVAILQALLAGIGFKLAAISSAGLLALFVLLLSIVQIGATIVLIPVVIWIWMDKDVTIAIMLTAYLVVVGLLDNVLKPLVMGRGLSTPTAVILAGVIGGTLAHGIIGLFIGPIILSVAWELTAAWLRIDGVAPAPPDEVWAAETKTAAIPH